MLGLRAARTVRVVHSPLSRVPRAMQVQALSTSPLLPGRSTLVSRMHTTSKKSIPAVTERPPVAAPTDYRRVLTLPNAISGLRVASAPAIAYCVTMQRYGAALGLLTAAALSDAFDGWLARRWNQQTALGSVLDPLGDKAIALCIAGSYAYMGLIPVPLAGLVVARDASMIAIALVVRWRSLLAHFADRASSPCRESLKSFADTRIATPAVAPNALGKANTVVQLVLFIGTLVYACIPRDSALGAPVSAIINGLQLTLAGTTVASSVVYALDYSRVVRILKH